MNYFLGIIGTWIFSDAIYSYFLYRRAKSWRGDQQDFWNDHWVRLVRGILGLALIIMGAVL